MSNHLKVGVADPNNNYTPCILPLMRTMVKRRCLYNYYLILRTELCFYENTQRRKYNFHYYQMNIQDKKFISKYPSITWTESAFHKAF